ncbi:MAG: RagB/SusD family nutrient uptake outer membrane protein [Prolixibacteraceae bacterium]|nr:RagB/SusD family nutrient uptake outer membrane protein [Prolixibacteraceae bacterium]MBN2772921.1 RagB/SusD family nutrient uptake outer membrane protein [Prolixibacteraceae bacterium]
MKKIIYTILVATAFMLSIQSCEEFLVEDNKVGQTADLTYSTNTGIQGLVASCYSFARTFYGKEAGLGLSEMGTDLFYYGYDNKQKSLNSYNITSVSLDGNTADNACLDQYWEAFYCAVDVCNTALQFVPLCEVISESTRSQFMGEAYFLRAFYYFHMVNIWGAIPYNEEAINSIITNPTRTSEEEVYTNILSDLDKSIAAFQDANYMIKTEGRASYWAARALKARVLLYSASWLGKTENYGLAKTEAEAVINSGIASFYSNYSDTWSMNNEDVTVNKEAIWGVTYSSDIATNVNCVPYRYKTGSNGSQLQYNGLITRTGYSRGGNAMLLMFVGMWNNGASDLGGNGKETFVRALGESTYYITNIATGDKVYVADTYSPYGRGFTRYLPSLYLWNLLEDNRATDQRTEGTILDAYTIAPGLQGSSKNYPLIQDTAIYYCGMDANSPKGQALQAWAKDRYRIQFQSGGDIPVYTSSDPSKALPTEAAKGVSNVYGDARYNTYKIGGWCSFPGIKKFQDNVFNPAYPTHDLSSRDAFVLRLAEMYLIKAEAELGAGNSSAALATLNQLRAVRAIPGKNNSLSGSVNINTILDERAIELCGEQQRWFDLKRTKTLVDRVKAYNAQASGQIQSIHYYRPIPQAQLDAVTNLTNGPDPEGFWQNPGY